VCMGVEIEPVRVETNRRKVDNKAQNRVGKVGKKPGKMWGSKWGKCGELNTDSVDTSRSKWKPRKLKRQRRVTDREPERKVELETDPETTPGTTWKLT
jgi:hypothetical protein